MLETDFEALSPWGYKRVEFEVAERADFFGESWSAAKFLALPLQLGEERRVCTPTQIQAQDTERLMGSSGDTYRIHA